MENKCERDIAQIRSDQIRSDQVAMDMQNRT